MACDSDAVVSGGGNSSETPNALLRSVQRADGTIASGDSVHILPEVYYSGFSIRDLKQNQHFEGVLDTNGDLLIPPLQDGRYWLEIHGKTSALGQAIQITNQVIQNRSASLRQNNWIQWGGVVCRMSCRTSVTGSIYILGTERYSKIGNNGKFEFSRISAGEKKVAAEIEVSGKKYGCLKVLDLSGSQTSDTLNFSENECVENKYGTKRKTSGSHGNSAVVAKDELNKFFAKSVDP